MGFFSDFAKSVLEGASFGIMVNAHVNQVADELVESPPYGWPSIIDAAYAKAEADWGTGDKLSTWSQAFSARLMELQKQDSRFQDVDNICLVILAKRGLEKLIQR